ncbi:hypothetical protein [Protofrankia symbiont of Coriaria ruscifolia]|uniref:Toxin-antitoxin system protein n=1 Tax=Candidatus Protofrankia californiensis TaxID=1839754 RepID=A0A1C3NWZ8_9ACTN|nr:hypothetical protein [Protofrankia symbiont of Coriaria ruscifolia]SBW21742.1 hypothetical protein FDG2_2107 [Candidatus Protofrankia californiensis]
MGTTTTKITTELRDRLASVSTDLGGVTLAETLQRLISEHEERAALAAYDRLRADEREWASYLEESQLIDNATGDWLRRDGAVGTA